MKSSGASSVSSSVRSTSVDDPERTRTTSPEHQKHKKPRQRSESYSSMYGHPVATRASMVQAAQDIAQARTPSPATYHRHSSQRGRSHSRHDDEEHTRESTSVTLPTSDLPESVSAPIADERTPLLISDSASPASHTPHPEEAHNHSGGHGNGSMNMRALLLHVFGDALGNVGVIATGLVIWLSHWSFKYYCDPVISLVITVIIFSSALPLGKCT